MSKQEYLESLYTSTKHRKLLKRHEREVMKIYHDAFLSAYKEICDKKTFKNGTARKAAKAEYVKQLHDELLALEKEWGLKIPQTVLEPMMHYMNSVYPLYSNEEMAKLVKDNVSIVSEKAVKNMIKGDIYKDGKGLSERLWVATNGSGNRIDRAINSMIAQGMSSEDMAKNLTDFATVGHKLWDSETIREKLGDGYARTVGRGTIDYAALRLARTTHTHLAQLSVINSSQVNPYVGGIIWHSAHIGGRTCKDCISREGKFFLLSQVPFDHPNGLCFNEPAFMINGKPATMEEIGQDIGKWVRGEPNSGTMDKIPEYKALPVDERYTKKVQKAEEQVEKEEENKTHNNNLDEFNKWVDMIEERCQEDPLDSYSSAFMKQKKKALKQWNEHLDKEKERLNSKYSAMKMSEAREHAVPNRAFRDEAFKKAYNSYVATSNSFKINQHMYEGTYKPGGTKKYDKQVDALKSIISNYKLHKDTKLVRLSGWEPINTIMEQLGAEHLSFRKYEYKNNINIDKDKLKENSKLQEQFIAMCNKSLAGKEFKFDSFTSTSYDVELNVFGRRPVELDIYAPEGLPAMITQNHGESEVILQAGTKFKIIGFEMNEKKVKMIIEALL